MSLVSKDDMTKLRSAADSRSTSSSAEDDIQVQAVAYAINQSANTGLYEVMFQEKLRDNVKSQLESKGYTIRYVDNNAYDMKHHALISWKEEAITLDAPSNSGPKYNTR